MAKTKKTKTKTKTNQTDESNLTPDVARITAAAQGNNKPAPRGARPTSRDGTGRRKRVPLGTAQPKLVAAHRPGYVRRFVNDWPGRLARANVAGYEHVIDENAEEDEGRASYRSEIVGVNEDGSPLKAYLMEIPEEYYREDQMEKDKPLAQFDEELRRGNIREADQKDADRYYVPDTGISVRTD